MSLFAPTQDALKNSGAALELASAWRSGEFGFKTAYNVEPAYVVLIAVSYFLFGYNLYIACVFNLIASLCAIYYIHQLALILFSRQEARLAAIIFAVMPYLNFMSFFFNREIIVIALMIYLTYALIFFLKENQFKSKVTELVSKKGFFIRVMF